MALVVDVVSLSLSLSFSLSRSRQVVLLFSFFGIGVISIIHVILIITIIGFRSSDSHRLHDYPEVRSPAQSNETTIYPDLLFTTKSHIKDLVRQHANTNALRKITSTTVGNCRSKMLSGMRSHVYHVLSNVPQGRFRQAMKSGSTLS